MHDAVGVNLSNIIFNYSIHFEIQFDMKLKIIMFFGIYFCNFSKLQMVFLTNVIC